MIGSRQGWKEALYAECPAGVKEIAARLVANDGNVVAYRLFHAEVPATSAAVRMRNRELSARISSRSRKVSRAPTMAAVMMAPG